MLEIKKIKVGNRFWLSELGLWIFVIGTSFFLLFLAILFIGSRLTLEMKIIYYVEIMHRYVYYGFGLSIATSLLGFWLSDLRIWTKTDLIIDNDRIEFEKNGKKVNLPRKRILKLIRLKSYFFTDNKVKIRTIGLKRYLVRMDNSVYNQMIEIYSDRFYEK